MRRTMCVAVALAVATIAGPAGAKYSETGGGLTCGFLGTGNGAGPQKVVSGTVFAGPWLAPAGHPDALVQIRCILQAVRPEQPPRFVGEAMSAPTPTTNNLPPTPMTFGIDGTEILEICTEVVVYWDSTPHIFWGDADHDPNNGAQCDDAAEDDDVIADVYYDPSDPAGGDICADVNHPYYPPVPRGVCAPFGPP